MKRFFALVAVAACLACAPSLEAKKTVADLINSAIVSQQKTKAAKPETPSKKTETQAAKKPAAAPAKKAETSSATKKTASAKSTTTKKSSGSEKLQPVAVPAPSTAKQPSTTPANNRVTDYPEIEDVWSSDFSQEMVRAVNADIDELLMNPGFDMDVEVKAEGTAMVVYLTGKGRTKAELKAVDWDSVVFDFIGNFRDVYPTEEERRSVRKIFEDHDFHVVVVAQNMSQTWQRTWMLTPYDLFNLTIES